MIETFTIKQQEAIEEKTEQLQKVIDGTLTAKELAAQITERRLNWLNRNRDLLGKDLPLLEAAYRLLIFNHMKVEEGIEIKMDNEDFLTAKCRNFCPYLEASKQLGLDTKFVCGKINEPSLKAFFRNIDRRICFFRDYDEIRPYTDYCSDFLLFDRYLEVS